MEYSPWNSPGQNAGVGSLSLLQGDFPTQELNLGLPHCRQILYQLSHKGSPSKYDRRMSSHTLPHFVPSTDLQGRFPILQMEKVVHGDVYCFIQGQGDINELVLTASQLCYFYKSRCLLGGIISVESFDSTWYVRFELTLWLIQQAHPMEVSREA